MSDETQAQLPAPDPALRRLDRFVGTWSMEGHLIGSDDITVRGQTTFRWLPGGFFLEQRNTLNFLGMEIDSLELIGYEAFDAIHVHERRPTMTTFALIHGTGEVGCERWHGDG